MKINETVGSQPVQGDVAGNKTKKAVDSNGFDQLLQQEITETRNTATQSARAAFAPASIAPLTLQPDSLHVEALGSELESALDRWSGIQDLIASPQFSPKDVQTQLDTAAAEAAGLHEKCQNLPADHPLRQVSNELMVLSQVESLKWNRGDYL